jgi:hypothetical protein
MISSVLIFAYIVGDLVAIAFGISVLFGLLHGELHDKSAVLFLKCALIASMVGLIFPSPHLLPSQKVSMISVYVSGLAILAWHKFHLAGPWRSVFVLSMTVVLYMSVLASTAQAFTHISPFVVLAPRQFTPQFIAAHLAVMSLFLVLGIEAAKRFCHRPFTPYSSLRRNG